MIVTKNVNEIKHKKENIRSFKANENLNKFVSPQPNKTLTNTISLTKQQTNVKTKNIHFGLNRKNQTVNKNCSSIIIKRNQANKNIYLKNSTVIVQKRFDQASPKESSIQQRKTSNNLKLFQQESNQNFPNDFAQKIDEKKLLNAESSCQETQYILVEQENKKDQQKKLQKKNQSKNVKKQKQLQSLNQICKGLKNDLLKIKEKLNKMQSIKKQQNKETKAIGILETLEKRISKLKNQIQEIQRNSQNQDIYTQYQAIEKQLKEFKDKQKNSQSNQQQIEKANQIKNQIKNLNKKIKQAKKSQKEDKQKALIKINTSKERLNSCLNSLQKTYNKNTSRSISAKNYSRFKNVLQSIQVGQSILQEKYTNNNQAQKIKQNQQIINNKVNIIQSNL